jgi:hypothetical protein
MWEAHNHSGSFELVYLRLPCPFDLVWSGVVSRCMAKHAIARVEHPRLSGGPCIRIRGGVEACAYYTYE